MIKDEKLEMVEKRAKLTAATGDNLEPARADIAEN